MVYDRYYYSILPKADQQIYRSMYHGIEKMQKTFTFFNNPNSQYPLGRVLYFIGLDNPHLFYVDFHCCSISETPISKTIELTYWYSRDEIAILKAKVDTILGKMLSHIKGKTEYEKELAIHDMLASNVTYNFGATEHPYQYAPRASSIIGVLFYKTATCGGISMAAKMLLNLCDIKCIVAEGTAHSSEEAHAWNIVKIEGTAYHLDITWDINASSQAWIRHDYFNLTDRDILKDHSPAVRYPECNSTKYNFYRQNGLCVNDEQDISKLISSMKMQGKRVLTFRYIGDNQMKFKSLVKIAGQQLAATVSPSPNKSVQLSSYINHELFICSMALKGKN